MPGVYLTKDLFFASRVTAAARAAGSEMRVVGTVEALRDAAGDDCSLVLLDLNSPNADPAAVVAALREREGEPPVVVAFGSHVHEARLDAAREAGCNAVLTRGQFDRQVGELLQMFLKT